MDLIYWCTVEEALPYPYLERLHDTANEPICMEPLSFEFKQHALSEDQNYLLPFVVLKVNCITTLLLFLVSIVLSLSLILNTVIAAISNY